MRKIILLGGPTASGKSSLALKWAAESDGEIVNGDSMQIYKELDILTACPSEDEMAMTPHHLYRVLKGDDACSAERWREMARGVIDDVWSRGKVPIIVGGTGLYLKALVYGLSKVPEIDEEIRAEIREEIKQSGSELAHEKLSNLDPEMAGRLAPGDSQRIGRALEVILATKRSLAEWQKEPLVGGLMDEDGLEIKKNVLERDRAVLYERCNDRFDYMIREGGAIEEVSALMELNYPENVAVMKSLGVPQIIEYLKGNISLDECVTLAQTATRQFAKRQMTWFRNQFSDWNVIKL
ncbi:tRNA (adenosine(37)-N6)-dimethylallyltransferase MiaA [Pseudemcibacter aquimaris]|uniref:tRNA (adenosine(37)-N6)-dimethylallyltransferase MiaA n=1 Tax=Pseudemcibacter aquimaris TaxID=2857064 RepID=UPI0020135AF3|nr:tRNA (adenosine(37)-N6)-dimethylallyltransferase MiaA [Pseudemcibacter aquimaris]MCC3860259.1 tRNA (adenosine(37)-N6)-dimethylallyltransferase MiaA [Pseudemcibacter aquimaris]WDU57584.1 tRNA (adenosine(37)-N6)-dimethylallyltransferase MiaA [Pseudemcibacter aquimaris]